MANKRPRKLPSCFQQGMGESGLPKMDFSGKVYYCAQKDECNFICSELRAKKISVLGFDMEWKVTFNRDMRKTALIQICPSKDTCYLFHVFMMNGFPPELRQILESDAIIKVGVGISSDMQKLRKDFDIEAKCYLDLSDFANRKYRSNEKWSLNGLTMHLMLDGSSISFIYLALRVTSCSLGRQLSSDHDAICSRQSCVQLICDFKKLFKQKINKDTEIRCSDWEMFPLSQTQEKYAAIDAYVSYAIYYKVIERELPV